MKNKFPEIKNIKFKKIPQIKKAISKNGIKIYSLNDENIDIIKVSIIFNVGIDNEDKFLVANFTNLMYKEASIGKSADEIAEFFDFYGSSIGQILDFETIGLELNAPLKFFHNIFPYFAEIITNSSFPEKEFEIAKAKYIEKLKLFSKKTNYVANSALNSIIFGNDSSRGHIITKEDVDNIKIEDIKKFANQHLIARNASIYMYGNLNDELINYTLSFFENNANSKWNSKTKTKNNKENISNTKSFIKKINNIVNDSQQSSLYMAIKFDKLSEEEFIDLSIINTILGGYFGSRLMENIREKNAYTYGIYSFILEYSNCIILKIASDLGKNYVEKTIEEIKKEITKLQTINVGYKELERIKNYLLGDLISTIDGSHNQFITWKSLITKKRNNRYLQKAFKRIEVISPKEIKLLSRKFLQIENLFVSVAG